MLEQILSLADFLGRHLGDVDTMAILSDLQPQHHLIYWAINELCIQMYGSEVICQICSGKFDYLLLGEA